MINPIEPNKDGPGILLVETLGCELQGNSRATPKNLALGECEHPFLPTSIFFPTGIVLVGVIPNDSAPDTARDGAGSASMFAACQVIVFM